MAKYLKAADVARLCSHDPEKPVSKDNVYRWVRHGLQVRGKSQEPVKLRCVVLPGGLAFTQADVDAFKAAIAAAWGLGGGSGEVVSRESGVGRRELCRPEDVGTYPAARGGRRRRRAGRGGEVGPSPEGPGRVDRRVPELPG